MAARSWRVLFGCIEHVMPHAECRESANLCAWGMSSSVLDSRIRVIRSAFGAP
jgi:hypothetical protein